MLESEEEGVLETIRTICCCWYFVSMQLKVYFVETKFPSSRSIIKMISIPGNELDFSVQFECISLLASCYILNKRAIVGCLSF